MLNAEAILEQLAEHFPSHEPESTDDLLPIGFHCRPESIDGKPNPKAREAAEYSFCAVRESLLNRGKEHTSKPTDADYEILFIAAHLHLLSPPVRRLVYPLGLEAFIRFGAHSTEQYALYRQSLEYLLAGELTREQESVLLVAWCYQNEKGYPTYEYQFDAALLWAFLMDQQLVIPPDAANSLILGYRKELAEITQQEDLWIVPHLSDELIEQWFGVVTKCRDDQCLPRPDLSKRLSEFTPRQIVARIQQILEASEGIPFLYQD
jgi:hypothetical protein